MVKRIWCSPDGCDCSDKDEQDLRTLDIIHSLARTLCNHAQEYMYDHGPTPTVDMNVGACPRHIAIATGLVDG